MHDPIIILFLELKSFIQRGETIESKKPESKISRSYRKADGSNVNGFALLRHSDYYSESCFNCKYFQFCLLFLPAY